MILKIKDYETSIQLDEKINVLSIHNKKLFYNIVSNLYSLNNGDYVNEYVDFFDNEKQSNLANKIICYTDFFNIEYNTKNVLNKLYSNISDNLDEDKKRDIQIMINDIIKMYNNYISNIDIDLTYNDSLSFIDLCKLLKLHIKTADNDLIDKILLIIDIEAELHINEIIVLINLGQFLNDKELRIIYENIEAKKVRTIFIENNIISKIWNENIYVIDNNFDEYMI